MLDKEEPQLVTCMEHYVNSVQAEMVIMATKALNAAQLQVCHTHTHMHTHTHTHTQRDSRPKLHPERTLLRPLYEVGSRVCVCVCVCVCVGVMADLCVCVWWQTCVCVCV